MDDINVLVNCAKCSSGNLNNDFFKVEIDEGFFNGKEVTCNNGHLKYFISVSPRYQYLIQQGIEAFVHGFYIESFHALYSGYEAYKKEFLSAYLLQQIGDIQESEKIIKRQYNRSERLDGAFVSAYITLSEGKLPKLLTDDSVKIRNSITHKGFIATKENCITVGNQIFEFIALSNNMINNRCLVQNIDFHPLLLSYEGTYSNFILNKKGFKTTFDSLDDFNNKPFINHQFSLNLLSPNTILEQDKITDDMFEKEVTKNAG